MPILPQLPNWRDRRIPAGVIIGWPSTNASIPTGWTRETSLDARFPRMIPTSGTNPGTAAGSATHDHPFAAHSAHTYSHNHAGSWGTSPSGGGNIMRASGGSTYNVSHTHPSSSVAAGAITVTNNSAPANFDTAASDPLHVTQVFIKSTGAAIGIPNTGLVWYNGAAPTGWAVYASIDTRFMKGAAAAGDGGTQAGTDGTAHTHTSATHTHPVGGTHTHVVSLDSIAGDTSANSPQFAADAPPHGHTLGTSTTGSNPANTDATSETTGTGDGTPQWYKLRAIQPNGVGTTKGIICMWLGTIANIPAGWILCDGTNGTPNLANGKFVMAAASDGTVGNTGGNTTHTHAAATAHSHTSSGTHSHTFTGASSTDPAAGSLASGTFQFFNQGHSHASATYTSSTVTIGTSSTQATTQSANTSNNPVYTDVAYIQKLLN